MLGRVLDSISQFWIFFRKNGGRMGLNGDERKKKCLRFGFGFRFWSSPSRDSFSHGLFEGKLKCYISRKGDSQGVLLGR